MKRFMTSLAIAALLPAAECIGAQAADLGPRGGIKAAATTPAPAPMWSGLYLGGSAGYAGGDHDAQEINGPRNYLADFNGATGALHLGWQRQFGPTVAGIEVEAGYFGMGSTVTRDVTGGSIASGADLRGYGAISGRFGVLAQPNWLIYGRAGVVAASVDSKTTQTCMDAGLCGGAQNSPVSEAAADKVIWGLLLGAGTEVKLDQHWSARLEYRFLGSRKELALPLIDGPGWNHSINVHMLNVGVSYQF